MKSNMWIKMLKEAKVIGTNADGLRMAQMSTTDADIIYKLYSNKQHLTFDRYL